MISPESLIVIGAVALVIFGPKKLPELGKAAGKTLREFKKSTQDILDFDIHDEEKNKDKTVKDEEEKTELMEKDSTLKEKEQEQRSSNE